MTPETRAQIVLTRSADYYGIMRTTLFTLLGIAAIIQLGPEGYSAPLVTLSVAAVAYGVLGGGSALDDIIALREDMDAEMAGTHYGRVVNARNLPALKLTSAVLLSLVGLAEVFAILI